MKLSFNTSRGLLLVLAILINGVYPVPLLADGSRSLLPIFAVDRDVIDLGNAFSGQVLHYEFVVTNTGTAPLSIKAKPSCGCTVARFDETIAPGGQGKIEADLSTQGLRDRRLSKSLRVTTNDPKTPEIELVLKAQITASVQIHEGKLDSLFVLDEEPTTHEIKLLTRGIEPVQITSASCRDDYIKPTLQWLADEHPAGGGQLYSMTLTIDPSAPAGPSQSVIVLGTTAPGNSVVTIPVSLKKGIMASANHILLVSNPSKPEPFPSGVLSLARHQGSFKITKVASIEFELQVITETVSDGQEYRLTLINQSAIRPGVEKGTIRIETDDPAQPLIELPAISVRVDAQPENLSPD